MIAKIKKILFSIFYFLFSRRAPRGGQLIIEAIVSAAVLIIGFEGSLALLSRAFRYNRVVTDSYIGTYLAAEGVEIAKNVLDHNFMAVLGCGSCSPPIPPCSSCTWLDNFTNGADYDVEFGQSGLLPYSSSPLLYDSATGMYGYTSGQPTSYQRRVHVNFGAPLLTDSSGNPVEIEIQSTVFWTTGFWSSSASLVDKFYDWRQAPPPPAPPPPPSQPFPPSPLPMPPPPP